MNLTAGWNRFTGTSGVPLSAPPGRGASGAGGAPVTAGAGQVGRDPAPAPVGYAIGSFSRHPVPCRPSKATWGESHSPHKAIAELEEKLPELREQTRQAKDRYRELNAVIHSSDHSHHPELSRLHKAWQEAEDALARTLERIEALRAELAEIMAPATAREARDRARPVSRKPRRTSTRPPRPSPGWKPGSRRSMRTSARRTCLRGKRPARRASRPSRARITISER